ncbi:MAG: TonB family protein [Bacteroidota bacterium]|nr:TonB family protein [Bacteroidota bacterium]
MEANKVLNASLLDIIFEGRNKQYGAYQLRKTYNWRLIKALLGMVIVTILFLGAYTIASRKHEAIAKALYVRDVQLEQVSEEKKNEPPPPPPVKQEPPKVEVTKFTPPRIVKDNEVNEDEKPPEQQRLQDTRIGAINQEGVKDEGVISPNGADAGKGVVAAPAVKETEDYDKTFMKVEIESEFPGGLGAWMRYLNKNFRYPDEALSNEIQGTVIVQFIVDKEGIVSEVEAISGPTQGGLREEAIRVIEKSGKWTPAIQNGRKVKSYKRQPVIFKMSSQ